jgi:hypothetical protein
MGSSAIWPVLASLVALCRLTRFMTLGMNEFGVLGSVTVGSVLSVQFRILQRYILSAMGTFAVLLPPLHPLEFRPSNRLAPFVVAWAKFFDYFGYAKSRWGSPANKSSSRFRISPSNSLALVNPAGLRFLLAIAALKGEMCRNAHAVQCFSARANHIACPSVEVLFQKILQINVYRVIRYPV